MLKNNLNNFSLLILEFCDKNHLDEKENYYITELKPQYNILQQANSSKGFNHSDETKLKMSLAHKGIKHTEESKLKMSLIKKGKTLSDETKLKISLAHKGKTLSDETKLKISLAHKGIKHTEESKLKISLAKKGKIPHNANKVIIEDIIKKEKIEYNSITEAARKLKISHSTLVKYKGKIFRDRFLITI